MKTNKIREHGYLKRDYDLIAILEDELTIDEIKGLLEKRIKILK